MRTQNSNSSNGSEPIISESLPIRKVRSLPRSNLSTRWKLFWPEALIIGCVQDISRSSSFCLVFGSMDQSDKVQHMCLPRYIGCKPSWWKASSGNLLNSGCFQELSRTRDKIPIFLGWQRTDKKATCIQLSEKCCPKFGISSWTYNTHL